MELIEVWSIYGQKCFVPKENVRYFTSPDYSENLRIVLKDGSEIDSFETLKDFLTRINSNNDN